MCHLSPWLQVHAIVLDLPAKVCARQAMGREQHEGGVQGAEAERISYSVVSRLHKEGLPAKAEGFSSITVRAGFSSCMVG